MDTKKVLGENMVKLRKTMGFSQEEFANEIGMSPYYYRCIEHGKANPTIDRLQKIADGLGIEVAELLKIQNN